jgi:hypothetical protein
LLDTASTKNRSARLTFPAGCHDRSFLRVVVAYALSVRNIEGLTLRINGEKLPYRRTMTDSNVVYETDALPTTLTAGPVLNIDFDVDALDTLPGTARQFGVAVRRVELIPIRNLALPKIDGDIPSLARFTYGDIEVRRWVGGDDRCWARRQASANCYEGGATGVQLTKLSGGNFLHC